MANLSMDPSATMSANPKQTQQIIEVGTRSTSPKIAREGYQLPPPKLDPQQAGNLIANLEIVQQIALPRIVGQTPGSGTPVAPGSAIDIVVAPKSDVTWDVFGPGSIHADLIGASLANVDTLLKDSKLRQTVLTKESVDELTDDEKNSVKKAFQDAGVPVSDTDPTRNLGKAYNSLRNGISFK